MCTGAMNELRESGRRRVGRSGYATRMMSVTASTLLLALVAAPCAAQEALPEAEVCEPLMTAGPPEEFVYIDPTLLDVAVAPELPAALEEGSELRRDYSWHERAADFFAHHEDALAAFLSDIETMEAAGERPWRMRLDDLDGLQRLVWELMVLEEEVAEGDPSPDCLARIDAILSVRLFTME